MKNSLLLNQVLKQLDLIKNFNEAEWDLLIRQARASILLARLYELIKQKNIDSYIPDRPLAHFNANIVKTKRQQQQVIYEVSELDLVFAKYKIPATFLKGAAYVVADKSAKLGRTSSDIDILVEKSQLAKVEKILCRDLWSKVKMEDYDQKYYRTWMHEIPPLIHLERQTVLDVHHNILPPTSSIVDVTKLLAKKELLPTLRSSYVLAPTDMLLHSATHLFHEGEFDKGLRDLTDLALLFKESAQLDDNFYPLLILRSNEIGLTLPLFLAQRYCQKILNISFPSEFVENIKAFAPIKIKLSYLDFIFCHNLIPHHQSCQSWQLSIAKFLLYLRAHWLRMPVKLLIPHLMKKSQIRVTKWFIRE